jgi:serine/threonine-protein kinase
MSKAELDGGSDRLGESVRPGAGDGGTAGTVTAGGGLVDGSAGPPLDGQHLIHAGSHAQLAGSQANGWFAGPHADPDRFELLGPGLAGGEGNIWRARYQGELTAPLMLAVKQLRRPAHAPKHWPTATDVRRWDDQRALLQYMRIDHLVAVLDIFVGPPPHLPGLRVDRRRAEETPYVVMEWVPGPTLAEELSGRPATASTVDERLEHVQHVAEALHSLHSRSVSAGNPTLHRDVKPTNCILDPSRGVVLVDVGTMRRVDDGYDHGGLHTPAYTAPEVLANPQASRTVASDLYSLGALAYFCVLGEDPPTPGQPEWAAQIEARLVPAARSAAVADVRGFVDHLRLMLQPSPQLRPADALSWSRRLRSLATPRLRHRPAAGSLLAAGLVGVAVLVVAVVAVSALRTDGFGLLSADPGSTAAAVPNSARTVGAELPGGRFGPPPGGGPWPPPAANTTARVSGVASHPGRPVRTRLAAITSPTNDSKAPLCVRVQGTSNLPAGRTLLLSVENLSAGDGVKHLRTVEGWSTPARLGHWQGVHFLGLPGDPAGGHYRIEVFIVPLATLRQQLAGVGGGSVDAGPNLPADSTVGASVFVVRAPLAQPLPC